MIINVFNQSNIFDMYVSTVFDIFVDDMGLKNGNRDSQYATTIAIMACSLVLSNAAETTVTVWLVWQI